MAIEFVFAPPTPTSLAVAGTRSRFPVRRVWCVGRNYAAHAREMGADPEREPPFFFAKPTDAVIALPDDGSGAIAYPTGTNNLHHEVELVVALHGGGHHLDAATARAAIFGCAVGVDLTRRDLQNAAKSKGQPWEMGKAFDQSAPIGTLLPLSAPPVAGHIWLDLNGRRRQDGDLADMIWPLAETIAHLSRLVEVRAGDLIFTGTPEGVGPLLPGDQVHAGIDGVGQIAFRVV